MQCGNSCNEASKDYVGTTNGNYKLPTYSDAIFFNKHLIRLRKFGQEYLGSFSFRSEGDLFMA